MDLRVGGVGGVSFAGRCSVSEVMVLAAQADLSSIFIFARPQFLRHFLLGIVEKDTSSQTPSPRRDRRPRDDKIHDYWCHLRAQVINESVVI